MNRLLGLNAEYNSALIAIDHHFLNHNDSATKAPQRAPCQLEESVLMVRLSSLGDVILTLPVLENVRRAWPGARVDVLVKRAFADVV